MLPTWDFFIFWAFLLDTRKQNYPSNNDSVPTERHRPSLLHPIWTISDGWSSQLTKVIILLCWPKVVANRKLFTQTSKKEHALNTQTWSKHNSNIWNIYHFDSAIGWWMVNNKKQKSMMNGELQNCCQKYPLCKKYFGRLHNNHTWWATVWG